MPYAIIVKVPDARNDCFIAMPFAKKFEGIFSPIVVAATRVNLRPVRIKTGEMQPGVDFDHDIINSTRAAKLVIAVCSPEEAKGKPNPNVMYELGWAHALGKPTLILTNDVDTLPSDLKTKHVLAYEDTEIGTNELIRKIRENMRDVLEHMNNENPLTDPSYEDIYVAHERHLMFHNPAFWDNFRNILSFAKLTHDEHQQIDTAAIDKLFKEAKEMYDNPGQAQRVSNFLLAWGVFDAYYQNVTWPNVYKQIEEALEKADESFEFLKRAEAGQSLRRNVNDCYGFYKNVKDRLTKYPRLHKESSEGSESNSLHQQDPEAINRVFFQISQLSRDTKSIVINSDRLIVNLIEMIRKTGD
jgi:hypothetical protein